MPVILSDEEYEELKRKAESPKNPNESALDTLTRELASIPDNDKETWRAAVERYNARNAEEQGFDDEGDQPMTPDEVKAAHTAFVDELDDIPDGDKNAINELAAKHGLLPATEG